MNACIIDDRASDSVGIVLACQVISVSGMIGDFSGIFTLRSSDCSLSRFSITTKARLGDTERDSYR